MLLHAYGHKSGDGVENAREVTLLMIQQQCVPFFVLSGFDGCFGGGGEYGYPLALGWPSALRRALCASCRV